MLYDGALRFMVASKHSASSGDLEGRAKNLQRAQEIVTELMSCLDLQRGSDIAVNLMALYTYVLEQLTEANSKSSSEAVDRAIQVMGELRDSWAEIENQLRSSNQISDLAA